MARIVVIDDEPNILLVLRLALTVDKHQIETFKNGKEALARLQNGPLPDLVISDLRMPGLGGRRLAEVMHKDEKLKEVPICILSGYVQTDDVLPESGLFDAFVAKPFDLTDLLQTVNRLTVKQEKMKYQEVQVTSAS